MILRKWVLSERDEVVTATRELLTAKSLRARSELTKEAMTHEVEIRAGSRRQASSVYTPLPTYLYEKLSKTNPSFP